ncbi:hypothetical protein DFH06DRAFT_1091449 [Mycena polygramma]|nr:hypothetical protein DFH06DRAFT_1091449 [Mycena polygramma]
MVQDHAIATEMAPNQRCLVSLDSPVDPSPISREILDTNDPPAEFHLPSIREFVSSGSSRRTLLDARIAPLKAELEKLQRERDALDVEIRKHEGALSPLRRLPTEIISAIFTLALPPFASCSNLMNVQEGPWVLSAVCSRWRAVVLSQPCFWTSLSLDFMDDPPDSASLVGLVPTLEAHLERSQQSPLNITFRTFYDMDIEEREQRVLDLITLCCHRWETVELSGPWMLYTSPSLGSTRGDLPLLRSLSITVQELGDPGSVLDVFQSCPQLQEVFFNPGRYGGSEHILADLPSSQLRRYSASNSWANHVHILHSASNLVDCVLRAIPSGMGNLAGYTIVLPHLLRLSVSTNTFLPYLDTPALQELYCCEADDRQSSGLGSLHSFLRRLPKLRQLFVADIPSALDVSQLLQTAPTITNLCLYLPMTFASDLFSILENSSQDDRTTSAPALCALSVCLGPLRNALDLGEPLDQDLMMRAIESQWRDGSLRTFRMYAMRFTPSVSTLERMEALRGQGMDIVHFQKSYILYANMIPEYFRLYDDDYEFFEHFLL